MATNNKTQVTKSAVSHPTTQQQSSENVNSEVSILNPTPEFLDKNYTVTDLRKYCRDLGATKVWVKKEQLIEQIINLTRSAHKSLETTDKQNNETENIPKIDISDDTDNTPNSDTCLNSEIVTD